MSEQLNMVALPFNSFATQSALVGVMKVWPSLLFGEPVRV